MNDQPPRRLARRFERERDDLLPRVERLDLELHQFAAALVMAWVCTPMSASSPLPPGLPSLP